MSTLKVDNLLNSAGNESPISVPGAAKAWVNFDGTGTVSIRDSFNISSITDNNTGDYTLNFTNAFANTDYVAVGVGKFVTNDNSKYANFYVQTPATTSLQCGFINPGVSRYDTDSILIAIFGD